MLIMKFNQFIQYHALKMKATLEGETSGRGAESALMEKALESSPQFKTVCAPISLPLFERLDATLKTLDISKRAFIEAAIINALDYADTIIERVDITGEFNEIKTADEVMRARQDIA